VLRSTGEPRMEKRLKAIAILALVSIFLTTLFGYGSAKGAEITFLYPNLGAAIRGTIDKFEARHADVLQHNNEPPAQPTNTSPLDGATDVSLTPLLQSSAFFNSDVEHCHSNSQWQITVTPEDYSTTAFDSGPDATNLTEMIVPSGILSRTTTYYWRARHQDNYGSWSEWSEETSFTTGATQWPAKPMNISPANGATGLGLTPTLQCSAFSGPDLGDIHAASQWQITTIGPHNIRWTVFDSEEDTHNLSSITIRVGTLYYYTGYDWRVRHKDSHGNWSDWSAETHFATIANQAPSQPINISPLDGATHVSLTLILQSSAFSDPEGDSHAASQWQITTKPGNYSTPIFVSERDIDNLTGITIPAGTLSYSTTYYWRVRHRHDYDDPTWHGWPDSLCWSDWSAETSFTTKGVPGGLSSWVWIVIGIGAATILVAGAIFRRRLIRK